MQLVMSVVGIVSLFVIALLLSKNRSAINRRTVIGAFALQATIGGLILLTPAGSGLDSVVRGVQHVINYANEGIRFLFGENLDESLGFTIAFNVLPVLVFFAALMSVLYYLGIMQKVVGVFGGWLQKLLQTSQAESVSAVSNIFVGHTDAPLVVRPYLAGMTQSELFAVMTGGCATIAGAVMMAYAQMGVDLKYLITASFMAAPGGILMAKIMLPETELVNESSLQDAEADKPVNIFEAIGNGAMTGMQVAMAVGAMLIAFVSLIYLLNGALGWIGSLFDIEGLTLQMILGQLLAPLAFLLGVPWEEASQAGSLIGQKFVINEFYAYFNFVAVKDSLSPHTQLIVTFALCGFANLSSIAILLGALGAVVPSRRQEYRASWSSGGNWRYTCQSDERSVGRFFLRAAVIRTASMKRAIILVLDSFGIGATADADRFGDVGANTFGNIAKAREESVSGPLNLPNLSRLGLFHAGAESSGEFSPGFDPNIEVIGAYGHAAELSSGKDTPSGHWEIAGVPVLFDWGYFSTEGDAFPPELLDELIERGNLPGILGNCHASGTTIIAELGDEHVASGKPIVYTSADSVFQIACHEESFGVERLYELCELARELVDKYNIGRVIARPFLGDGPESYTRTGNRRDLTTPPHAPTVLDKLVESGGDVISVGKIADIYAHMGITKKIKATGNAALFDATLDAIRDAGDRSIVFTNFVDFDMLYGHRRDPAGYADALEYLDERLPEILDVMEDGDLLILCADHGCDPTWPGSDHTREHIPVLAYGAGIKPGSLGLRESFADIGQSLAVHFDLSAMDYGESFV